MGCGIHLHQEIKINGEWHHYNHPRVPRNYRMFAWLADVRNENGKIISVSKPRGLPKDISFTTKFDSYIEGSDGHSHSYITAIEIVKFKKWYEKEGAYPSEKLDYLWFENIFGFLFGNCWWGYSDEPEIYPKELEDFRFVFWFDN